MNYGMKVKRTIGIAWVDIMGRCRIKRFSESDRKIWVVWSPVLFPGRGKTRLWKTHSNNPLLFFSMCTSFLGSCSPDWRNFALHEAQYIIINRYYTQSQVLKPVLGLKLLILIMVLLQKSWRRGFGDSRGQGFKGLIYPGFQLTNHEECEASLCKHQ